MVVVVVERAVVGSPWSSWGEETDSSRYLVEEVDCRARERARAIGCRPARTRAGTGVRGRARGE